MHRIIKYICDKYDISEAKLNSKDRHDDVVECRQMIWLLSKEIFRDVYSNSQIGAEPGRRDPTTVLWGVNHIRCRLEVEKQLIVKKEAYFNEISTVIIAEDSEKNQKIIRNKIKVLQKEIDELKRMLK